MCRDDQPPESQCWSQCFRHGSDLHDVLRSNTLQRTHRLPVVAELSVVVVLDDEAAMCACPRDQLTAPVLAQHTAGGELVRWSDQHRVGVEAADGHSLVVDRLRDHLQAGCEGALTRGGLRWVLNTDT